MSEKYDMLHEENGTDQTNQDNMVRESAALYDTGGYTVDFIENLPDGVRAELIDGQIFYMASPGRKHQKISGKLFLIISNYIEAKGGPCEIYCAPTGVYLIPDKKNYVEPDIVVVCDKDKLDDKGIIGAPDWLIEIVSPGSEKMDCYLKLLRYRSAGVREYWIVDPAKKEVTVYNFENDDMNRYSFLDKVKAGIYEDLYIDFSTINFD